MKITNVGVGYTIWLTISTCLAILLPYCYDLNENTLVLVGAVIGFFGLFIFFVVMIIQLLDNDIEFEIVIPNPFKSIQDYYKNKALKEKALTDILLLMSKEENSEKMDLLIKKYEILKNDI